MKNVTSYSHACEILNRDPEARPDVTKMIERDQKAFSSLHELTTIIEAQNKLNGFVIDWNNHSQWKYYPWLYVEENNSKPSGFGLSYHDYVFTSSYTSVGSRLVVGTSEEAKYIFETFTSLYEDWMLINK